MTTQANAPANAQANNNIPMTSLYVGDLHPDVTEAMLYEKFSSVGAVLSIRVCRDMVSRKSLGYAYVNFQNHAHAELAMENMNFDKLRGRPIRIMWSQRDPAIRKAGQGNIFIKNLDKNIDQKEIFDTFFVFGNILSCKIAVDEVGRSKGYGFIHYEHDESASTAIESVNGMQIGEKIVFAGPFIPRSQRPGQDSHHKFTNVFIKNFGDDLTDTSLYEKFAECGEIISAKVMVDANDKSKGFGFVCFKDAKHAEEAVNRFNNTLIGDRTIYVGRAQKKAERNEELKRRHEKQRNERTSRYATGVNLYVKNMDDTITDDLLKKEFEQFGTITSAKVMTDAGGRSKGFGFVCFANPEQATKAVTEMNGKICGSKPLYVALAQRKEDRQAHLSNQFMQRVAQYRTHPPMAGLPAMMQGGQNYMPTGGPGAPGAPMQHPAALHMFQQANPANPRLFNPYGQIPAQMFNNGLAAAGMNQLNQSAVHRGPVSSNPMGPGNSAAAFVNNFSQFGNARWNAAGQPGNTVPQSVGLAGQPAAAIAAQRQQNQQFLNQQQQSYAASATQMADPASIQRNLLNFQQQQMNMRAAGQIPNAQQFQQQQQQQQGRPITGSMHPRPGTMAAIVAGNSQMPMGVNAPANRNAAAVGIKQEAQPQRHPGNMMPTAGQAPESNSVTQQLVDVPIVERKQILGEKLFPLVKNKNPEIAGKITGMLLEIDPPEIVLMLENPTVLDQRIEEAIRVYHSHTSGDPGSAQENPGNAGETPVAVSQQPGAAGDSEVPVEIKTE